MNDISIRTPHIAQKLWSDVSKNTLIRNTSWVLGGQGTSALCQMMYFAALGRILGSYDYGIYTGAVALVAVLSQYSTLGFGPLFLRYVSGNPKNFAPYWGNILIASSLFSTVFTIFFVSNAPLFAPSFTRGLIFFVALGDCFCAQLTVAIGRIFQAFEKLNVTALIGLLTNVLRMAMALFVLIHYKHISAQQWALLTLAASFVALLVSVFRVTRTFGKPSLSFSLFAKRIREGILFAFSASTTNIYNDFDKVMLSHCGLNAANGIYTMAYRVVDFSMMPISSVHSAAFPRFFVKGVNGTKSTRPYGVRILAGTLPIAAILAVIMFLAAPLITLFVGDSFRQSALALRWLCLLPVFRCFHLSAGNALTGASCQGLRFCAQLLAALFNLGINLWLIPHYGWLGAAWSSLATDALLAAVNWTILVSLDRKRIKCMTSSAELL
jgi:O-antigen/teichoic acid export membrane protein